MSEETTPRDKLIATVALMRWQEVGIDGAWDAATAFVAGLEAAPDVPVKCPCCTKMVVLCREHWLLHAPDKKCLQCWDSE